MSCTNHNRIEEHIKEGEKFREKVLVAEIQIQHTTETVEDLKKTIGKLFDKMDDMKNGVDKSISSMLIKVFSGTFIFNAIAVSIVLLAVRTMTSGGN